jgi:hypothetical protein
MKVNVNYVYQDVTKVLEEKGLKGTWINDTIYEVELNTNQELDTIHLLSQTGFRVNGVPVTLISSPKP